MTVTKELQIYRVGGFVRDKLLGLPPSDCDYVVVGSSVAEMLSLGYQQVGKFFPVFLHPKTREEYALARTERKTGHGHTGFSVNSSSSVTLKEDLSRRDITINAIAQDRNGNLIDPFGGISDLKQGIIRHISDAFSDDPLRILRVARFAAKLNFTVAPETLKVLTQMADSKEGLTLSRERVLNELEKAISYKHPERFFNTLLITANLAIFFPSLALLANDSQLFDNLIHDLTLSSTKNARYMLLSIYLAKAKLPLITEELSLHKVTQQLLTLSQTLHTLLHKNKIDDDELLSYFKQLDIWRNFGRFQELSHYYLEWLQKHHITKLKHQLLNYITIATELKKLRVDQLPDKSIAELPKLIYQAQLKIIKNLRIN